MKPISPKTLVLSIKNVSETKLYDCDIFEKVPGCAIKVLEPKIIDVSGIEDYLAGISPNESVVILKRIILYDYNPFHKYHLKQLESHFQIEVLKNIGFRDRFSIDPLQFQCDKVAYTLNISLHRSFKFNLGYIMPEADMTLVFLFSE